MDQQEVMRLLQGMRIKRSDRDEILRIYAETVAAISTEIPRSELIRLLLCGVYLRQVSEQTPGNGNGADKGGGDQSNGPYVN